MIPTVIHQLMIHPICNNCFYNFLQLFILKKNYDNSFKINQNIFPKYEVYWVIFEWDTSKTLVYHWVGIHNSPVWFGCSTSKSYPFCLKIYREDHSIYYYVIIYLFFEKKVHVSSYMSVSLSGGVSLASGWL